MAVNSHDLMVELARSCRLLINCVGPFRYYGEPVVRACVEAGTHYLDVSGERASAVSMFHKACRLTAWVVVSWHYLDTLH